MTMETEQLPPHIEDLLRRQERNGVYTTHRPRGRITGIFWRPGDPNILAQQIISYVGDEEITLTLDGHKFLIRRAG
jgi:hypothetical protein